MNPILRFVDCFLSLMGLIILFPLIGALAIVCFLSFGKPLLFQARVGVRGKPFNLIKFCTLKGGDPYLPTHEMNQSVFSPTAKLLRKYKLDELPQLLNVIAGTMSLVGPRPSLLSQQDVIKERQKYGVLSARPGITGLAQVNGIDMSDPVKLAQWDAEMLQNLTLRTYFRYIVQTILGKGSGDRTRPS